MTRLLVLAWTFTLAVLAAAHIAASSPTEVKRHVPMITAATALGGGQVEIDWTGANAATVRVKRDCLVTCGTGAIYQEPNTGSIVLDAQPIGTHYYRVCDLSCSYPATVDVT